MSINLGDWERGALGVNTGTAALTGREAFFLGGKFKNISEYLHELKGISEPKLY